MLESSWGEFGLGRGVARGNGKVSGGVGEEVLLVGLVA